MTQREKCDSLDEGYVLESWDFTRISVTQTIAFGKLIRFLIGSSPKIFIFERYSSYIEAR
ncbi:hypothetical protein Gotur_027089 [Gossypium turneri]